MCEIQIVTDVFDLVRFSEGLDKFKFDGHSAGAADRKHFALLNNDLVSRPMRPMGYAVDASTPDDCSCEPHHSPYLPDAVWFRIGASSCLKNGPKVVWHLRVHYLAGVKKLPCNLKYALVFAPSR